MAVADRKRGEEPIELAGLVYGTLLRGRLPAGFGAYLWPARERPPDPRRRLDVSYRVVGDLPAVEEIWAAEPGPRTLGRLALFREPAGFGLKVSGAGRGLFRLTAGAVAIEWQRGATGATHFFFSYALPLWLEWRGFPLLHASAVAFGDRAVAFVGKSSVGKSTLGAALARAGCRFVADDGLPLREDDDGSWRCDPGPPHSKLWPSALEGALGVPAGGLPRVHEELEKRLLPSPPRGRAAPAAGLRLAAVYVLDRRPRAHERVTSSSFTGRRALVRLIRHSLLAGPVAALGLSAGRLELLARVAARTPVRRLSYPTGGRCWPRVRQTILADLSAPV